MWRLILALALAAPAPTPADAAEAVTATRGTQARTLADRFAEVLSLADFRGARLDGQHDDLPAVQAAIAAIGKDRKTLIATGCVFLSAGVAFPSNVTVRFEGGWSGFTGPGAGQVAFRTPDGEYHLRRDFCSSGEWSDITEPLQNAVTVAAAVRNAPVVIDPGAYNLTRAIDVPSNVSIRGGGRNWGTNLRLANPGASAFRIEGADKKGGWVFSVRIEHLLIDASLSTEKTAPIVDIHQAYNIDVSDVRVQNTATQAVRVRVANAVTLDHLIAYGRNTGAVPGGLVLVDGTEGAVSIRLDHPDLEAANRGLHTLGTVVMDVEDPYVERTIVSYVHQISDGQVNIRGGLMASVNGYPLYIGGDNLRVEGTDLDPYRGPDRGGPGVYAPSSSAFQNIVLDVKRLSQPGFTDGLPPDSINWMGIQPGTSIVPHKSHRRWDLRTKVVAPGNAGKPVDLVRFWNVDLMRVKVTLWGTKAFSVFREECQFVVMANTADSTFPQTPVTCTPLEKTEQGRETIASLAVATRVAYPNLVLVVTPVLGGVQPISIQGELEADIIDGNVGGVYLQ